MYVTPEGIDEFRRSKITNNLEMIYKFTQSNVS